MTRLGLADTTSKILHKPVKRNLFLLDSRRTVEVREKFLGLIDRNKEIYDIKNEGLLTLKSSFHRVSAARNNCKTSMCRLSGVNFSII
jgi:hypothetical protein